MRAGKEKTKETLTLSKELCSNKGNPRGRLSGKEVWEKGLYRERAYQVDLGEGIGKGD